MNAAFSMITLGFKRYNLSLINSPYRTKMVTAGVIFGAADAFCQKFLEKSEENTPKKFDWVRCMNMALIGSFVSAPVNHIWYSKWASALVSKVTSRARVQPFISTAADQILLTPVTLSSFLFLSDYLKDFRSLKAAKNVQEKFWGGLTTNWKVWPPIILANFMFVPPQMRVLFVNAFGFFWSIYLSRLQNN